MGYMAEEPLFDSRPNKPFRLTLEFIELRISQLPWVVSLGSKAAGGLKLVAVFISNGVNKNATNSPAYVLMTCTATALPSKFILSVFI
jgi:hypothetical protein